MNRFVFFLCLSAFPCVLFGQNVSARVAGLENDQKYMELLGKEQQLHRMEDSVVRIIGDTRELFSSHSSPDEREKYGAEILRLEKELYEIRNRIGVTANEIGTIEQEFIVSNMNGISGLKIARLDLIDIKFKFPALIRHNRYVNGNGCRRTGGYFQICHIGENIA